MVDMTLIQKKISLKVKNSIKPFFILLVINSVLALIFSPKYPLESLGNFYILEGGLLLVLGGSVPLFSRSHNEEIIFPESSSSDIADEEDSKKKKNTSKDSWSTGRFLLEASIVLIILGIFFDFLYRFFN